MASLPKKSTIFIAINSNDLKHQNKYVVLIDPLDGSSNIDVNVSVGTIFNLHRITTPIGTPVAMEDFLQPGRDQVAGGLYYLWDVDHVGLYHGRWGEWLYP